MSKFKRLWDKKYLNVLRVECPSCRRIPYGLYFSKLEGDALYCGDCGFIQDLTVGDLPK